MPKLSDVDINIILKLHNEASEQLKKSLGEIKDETKSVGKESVDQNKKMQNEWKESLKQIKAFRADIMLAVAVIYALGKATQEYARYNPEARKSLDNLEVGLKQTMYAAGGLLFKLQQILLAAGQMSGINSLVASAADITIGSFDGQESVKQTVMAEQALRNFKQEQSDVNMLYQAGMMASDEYYQKITESEYNVQMVRQMSMQQMQQLAQLEMQIGNDSLMNAQRLTQERINLLNYYQQTYNTAHQGMAAFTVMLGQTIQTNLSKALLDVTLNVNNSREAFKQLEKAMIQAILNFMIQKVVAWALEKTLLAGTVASTSAAAAALALAWAPAAILASIATLGGAAASGTAAFAASLTSSLMMTQAANTAAQASGRSISVESQMVGGGQVLDQSAGWGGAQADGGDYLVTKPTLFLAGEAGAERATFTPLGKNNPSESRGGDVFVEIRIDNPVVSKRDDIDYLAEQVSKKLALEVERIR